jgi:hypothetical protein
MKTCPHCEAELKDSVIRCVRCGRPLREKPERETVSAAVGSAAAAPLPSATPAAVAPPRPAGPPTPVVTPPPNLQAAMGRSQLRALPTRRAWGPDWFMLLGGIMATAAGAIAYLAVGRPWVHLSITRSDIDGQELLSTALSLRGKAAFVGTAGIVLAIALAAFGLVWFFFGFQKGWTMPGVVNPALGFLVTAAGLISTVLASLVWFVWEDAMIGHARATGLTTTEMRELLDLQPAPLVEIERLPSLATFGLMMGLGFLASGIAWYAYRRRD